MMLDTATADHGPAEALGGRSGVSEVMPAATVKAEVPVSAPAISPPPVTPETPATPATVEASAKGEAQAVEKELAAAQSEVVAHVEEDFATAVRRVRESALEWGVGPERIEGSCQLSRLSGQVS